MATAGIPASFEKVTAARALREAIATMLAAVGTLLCTLTIADGTGPGVLAIVLCLSLSRSQLDRDSRHRIEAAVALPIVGVAALGVGLLLQRAPWFGAAVFVAGMFVSIWLRRFGPDAQRAGSLIGLPFVALLVTPPMPSTPTASIPVLLVPVVVALLALFWVSALHALARRSGFLPPPRAQRALPAESARETSLRPVASTRMAIQMAVALTLAFTIGYVFFAERWAWIVLTAFIVLSGNRGRLDVAYKSVQRIAGAAIGTIFALMLSQHLPGHDAGTAALILAAVFLGVWLRPLGYAWWALFVTIALALLQGFNEATPMLMLWLRLEEIAIGAAIGVATAWLVLPVRSTGVLRRRIADALSSLGSALDPQANARTPDGFIAAIAGVEQLAPAFRASRLVTRRLRRVQPADWIDALAACRTRAVALIESGEMATDVRRAVGTARRALLEPAAVLPALQELQRSLNSPARA